MRQRRGARLATALSHVDDEKHRQHAQAIISIGERERAESGWGDRGLETEALASPDHPHIGRLLHAVTVLGIYECDPIFDATGKVVVLVVRRVNRDHPFG